MEEAKVSNRIIIALYFPLLALFAACTTCTPAINQAAVQISGQHSASLTAGGFAFTPKGARVTCFDVEPNISIESVAYYSLELHWEFGLITPNGFIDTIGIFSEMGVVDSVVSSRISIAPNQIVRLSLNAAIGIDPNLSGQPLACRLRVLTNGKTILTDTLRFDSIPFESRYRGYIYNFDASADSIGVNDPPDSNDWQPTAVFTPRPVYPNPSMGATDTLALDLLQPIDSLRADLHITPQLVGRTLLSKSALPAGHYIFVMDRSGLPAGLYQLIINAYRNNIVTTSHGNVRLG
jgi:hypothetical protein